MRRLLIVVARVEDVAVPLMMGEKGAATLCRAVSFVRCFV
jgi:hypothetical protein